MRFMKSVITKVQHETKASVIAKVQHEAQEICYY